MAEKTLPLQAPQGTALRLIVLSEEAFGSFPLPSTGSASIGRSRDADVVVHHPSISRLHATLHLGGAAPVLEDLGSANGTKVRGKTIDAKSRVELAVGDAFELGGITFVLQRVTSRPRVRRVHGHAVFEARLEDECERATDGAGRFAMVRVRCEKVDAKPEAIIAALHAAAGPLDLVATYGPGNYEMLLLDAEPARAEEVAGVLSLRLKSAGVRVGIACCPRDGRNAGALIAKAEAGVRAGKEQPAGAPVVADTGMTALYEQLGKIAKGSIPVLLLGETGVGKELLAAHVHSSSARSAKPFVKVNCAALTESLLESELFGHEKGAFTGAVAAKAGLFETADGGTLFLDEVGETSPAVQAKLLRALESGEIQRVGATKTKTVDVRLVCATNRDLEAESGAGTFRRDLFFRLSAAVFRVPPLRVRTAEIEPLARMFLERAAAREGRKVPGFSARAKELLLAYSWPGNVRELKNVIERAMLLCEGAELLPEHLPVDKLTSPVLLPEAAAPGAEASERDRILAALTKTGGNQVRAAELLGISRRTLINRLEEYGLPRPRKGE